VGWINSPLLPNIQRLIFTTELWDSGFMDCAYSQSFQSAKSSDCCICCQVSFFDQQSRFNPSLWSSGLQSFGVPGLQRISHLHTPKLSNYESLNTSTSPLGHHHVTLLRRYGNSGIYSSHSIMNHFFQSVKYLDLGI
jgi:hypothetical protein